MADGEDDHPVPSTPYSSSKFSLTDNIAFKKVERRRRAKKDLIHKIESKKKALQCASDETEYRSAGLDLLGAAGLKEKSSPLLPIMHVDSQLSSTNEDEPMDQTPCSSETEDFDGADGEGDFDSSTRLMRDDFYAVDTTAGSLEGSTQMDKESLYMHELKQYNGIYPVSTHFNAFCLMDFNPVKTTLKDKTYVIVTRKAAVFKDEEWRWVYKCNACRNQLDILKTACSFHLTYNEFEQLQDLCLHSQAASFILKEFDAVNDIDPCLDPTSNDEIKDEECPVYVLPNSRFAVVWDSQNDSYGTVGKSRTSLVCQNCTIPLNCPHVQILRSHKGCQCLPEAFSSFIFSSSCTARESTELVHPVSSKRIPFDEQAARNNSEIHLITNHLADNLTINLYANDSRCQNCGYENGPGEDNSVNSEEIPLFMLTGIFVGRVSRRMCHNCQQKFEYDGLEDGILNMRSYLVSHRLLRNFMHHFLFGRMPMYTYFTVYCADMRAIEVDPKQLTYNKFKDSWYAFLSLLDIDLDEGFSCEICKDHPRMLIMDATSLSFRKEMIQRWNDFLQASASSQRETIKRISSFKDRVFIPTKYYRTLLEKYARYSKGKGKGKDKGKGIGLDYDSFQDLKSYLQENDKALFDLFCKVNEDVLVEDHIYSVQSESSDPRTSLSPSAFACPSVWQPFFLALSRATPACGLLHQSDELLATVNRLCVCVDNNESPDETDLATLRLDFPMLYELVMAFPLCKLPTETSPVLRKLILISQAPFNTNPACPSLTAFPANSHCHWPGLECVRGRGFYQIDKQGRDHDGFHCKKISRGHPSLLPGIFTMFCEHEICYGFDVMLSNESPDVPFTVLFSRFNEAPEYCIYDNACNLHDYCLNRQPHFFKRTKFLVDRLHWKNHVGCSIGYNMAKYPGLKAINSQINEQMNACLKRIKPQLSYMTGKNFLNHCKFYLWFRNRLTRERKSSANLD